MYVCMYVCIYIYIYIYRHIYIRDDGMGLIADDRNDKAVYSVLKKKRIIIVVL